MTTSLHKPELLKTDYTKCPDGTLGCCKAIKAVKYRDRDEQFMLVNEIDWCVANGIIVKRPDGSLYPSDEGLSLLAGMSMLFIGREQ